MKKTAKKRKPFPYARVARLWKNGRTVSEIGERIGCVDRDREDGDRFHTLRVRLSRMHAGYKDSSGKIVKLPYRISRKLVKAAKERHKQ